MTANPSVVAQRKEAGGEEAEGGRNQQRYKTALEVMDVFPVFLRLVVSGIHTDVKAYPVVHFQHDFLYVIYPLKML